jgi:hypothetical protein
MRHAWMSRVVHNSRNGNRRLARLKRRITIIKIYSCLEALFFGRVKRIQLTRDKVRQRVVHNYFSVFIKRQCISRAGEGQLSFHEGPYVTEIKTLTQQPLTMNRSRVCLTTILLSFSSTSGTRLIYCSKAEGKETLRQEAGAVLSTSD